jgi:hypothetical protein
MENQPERSFPHCRRGRYRIVINPKPIRIFYKRSQVKSIHD